MPFHANHLGFGKRRWNLENSSAVVNFSPPYHIDNMLTKSFTLQSFIAHMTLDAKILLIIVAFRCDLKIFKNS